MRVREARPVDATTVRAIARESWHAAYDDFLGAETVDETIDEWYAIDGLETSIEADEGFVFVAESARPTDVSGFVHVGPWQDDPSIGHLIRLYVRPDDWGDGIGTALLDRAEAALRDAGYDRLRLEVFGENAVGVSFYESRGFDRIGEETEAFGGGEYVVYTYEKRF